MIRKNIIQIMALFFVALLSSVYLTGVAFQKRTELENPKQNQRFAEVYSKVNLMIDQTDWVENAPYSGLAERLTLIAEIQSFDLTKTELLTAKTVKIADFNRSSQANTTEKNSSNVESHFYLPTGLNEKNQYRLNVTISLPPLNSPNQFIEDAIYLVVLLWCALLTAFLFYKFRWVSQLEDFSQHVLTSANNRVLKTKYPFHNVIGHALSQLILNNSHLIKSKSDLAEQIRKTSYVDEVTQLGNHLFFKAELQVRLHNHDEAESGLVVLLSFVDSETKSSKSLTPDHQVEVADLLRAFVGDINLSLVAKLKNSEYALILPNFTANQTDQFCRKLVDQLAKSVFDITSDNDHFIDIGISTYKQGFGYYNIMAEADMALRNAQLQGCNNWYVYGEPLPQHKSKGSLRWRTFLQRVLDRREIMLYSQDIHYYNNDGKSHKEILTRIQDGSEILSADTFLAMANQCGLAVDFDRLIVDSVIKHLLYRNDHKVADKYAVNLFTSSLLDNHFTSWLIGKLSSYPQLNKQLIFELPESQLSKNIDSVAPIMRQISSLGAGWCVEHFGAPDDDLSYLNKAPVNMVKVDRRIINNIANAPAQQLLLSSIIVSMRSRNIEIFAEGVEKKLDAHYLKTTDIDGTQGYHFDKPQKLQFLEKKLRVV